MKHTRKKNDKNDKFTVGIFLITWKLFLKKKVKIDLLYDPNKSHNTE